MRDVNVVPDKDHPQDWRVEDIDSDGDGGCSIAIFSGPYAEARAKRFADQLQTHTD